MATRFDGYCQEDLQKAPAPSLLQCSWCCEHDDRQNWFCCWRDTSAVVSCMSADEMKTVKYCRTSSSQDWAPGWQEQQNRRRARNLSSVINKSTTNREARNQMFNPYNQPVTLQAFMHFQLESPPKKKLTSHISRDPVPPGHRSHTLQRLSPLASQGVEIGARSCCRKRRAFKSRSDPVTF